MPRGRPYSRPGEERESRVHVRCTEDELAAMHARAAAAKMRFSAWVRSRLLGDGADDKADPPDNGEVSPEPAGCGPLK